MMIKVILAVNFTALGVNIASGNSIGAICSLIGGIALLSWGEK